MMPVDFSMEEEMIAGARPIRSENRFRFRRRVPFSWEAARGFSIDGTQMNGIRFIVQERGSGRGQEGRGGRIRLK